ncbi:hypothetical protein WDW37_14505 [Bdellovibrionota bacterium FG-1]
MAVDTTLLKGEVVAEPKVDKLDVEGLLADFLRALLVEQNIETGQMRQERPVQQ